LPSRSENFGVALVEAMASGLPVIVSEHVNLAREIVGANAGIVTPLQIESVQSSLGFLLDNPNYATEMGRRARDLVDSEFSWHSVGARLANFYRSLSDATAREGQASAY